MIMVMMIIRMCLSQKGRTALMHLMDDRLKGCVRLLLDSGCDKDAKDYVRYRGDRFLRLGSIHLWFLSQSSK